MLARLLALSILLGACGASSSTTPASSLTAGQVPSPTVAPTIWATPSLAPTATPSPTVRPTQAPTKFTIGGKVTDQNGQPISGIFIFVYRPAAPANSDGGSVACPLNPNAVHAAQINPRVDGSYQTPPLEPGTYFVRFATPLNFNYTGPNFWNGQNSCQTATPLELKSDITNVNFTLTHQ